MVVHQPASPSIWPAVPSLRQALSKNAGLRTWWDVSAVEEMMRVVCVSITKGHSGDRFGIDFVYDLIKGDVVVLGWERVGRLSQETISSQLLLFAFQSMFISIWVSRLEIAEFPDSVRRSAP